MQESSSKDIREGKGLHFVGMMIKKLFFYSLIFVFV